MLKGFFESPEIAAIFATKEKDKESVDTNEGSRLRIGKHSRKREHNTKRAVRSKARGDQYNSTDMFSPRKSRVDNEETIASLHEETDYYDYDDETGTIIKKKHSLFDCGSKQSSLEYDKSECDVDIKREDFMKQVTVDLSTGGDGYCPSDSAYETNHDDFTDSLERIMIKDTVSVIEDSLIDNGSNEGNFGKPLGKRESPYRRCRSSAICGRNCEICRGKNNHILPAKCKTSKKYTVDAINEVQRAGIVETFHQKDKYAGDKTNKKNCGMFSSKVREENVPLYEEAKVYFSEPKSTKRRTESGHNLHENYKFIGAKSDTQSEEQLQGNRNSVPFTSISIDSLDKIDSSLQEEDYFRTMPYSEEDMIQNHAIPRYAHELAGSADSGECFDEHMLPNLDRDDEMYEAFIRGPHLVMLYDFKAEHEEDISVWKGEVVLLLDNRDRDWVWISTESNNEGYVPRSLTAPYSYCEECRQEELRRGQLLEKDEVSSNASIPRSTSTNSRSSLASIRSNTKCSVENSPLQKRRDSPTGSIASQSHPDPLTSEIGLDVSYTSSYQMNGKTSQVSCTKSFTSQPNTIFHNQSSPLLENPLNFAENQANARKNTHSSLQLDRCRSTQGQKSFRVEKTNKNTLKQTNTVSRQLSLPLNSPNSQSFEPKSISQELMIFWQEKEREKVLKDGIKLVALSSYRTNEQGKLPVTAGDAVYVHLKDQKVPNWLWVYSMESNKFGFIPESVVDQLKSSIV